MRTSLKWIKDLVPGIEDLTPQEYLDAMTLSGSKGEYYVELDKNLENIVIGQILKIEKHPDADKMEQEKRSLRLVSDSFRKLLIVGEHTKSWSDDDGIQIISIYDFLLDLSSTD